MQAWHQPVRGEGEIRGDLQHFMLLLGADRAQPGIDVLQAKADLLEQDDADLRQLDAAIDAIEQARAESFLQPFDLLADRRLRSAELDRSSGKAAMASGGLEARSRSSDRSPKASYISCAYPSHCLAQALPNRAWTPCSIAAMSHKYSLWNAAIT